MKVTANNWQYETGGAQYQAARPDTKDEEQKNSAEEIKPDLDEPIISSGFAAGKSAESSDSGMKMKSSAPDDSVGQLAALLARSETKIDVQLVNSKAMRALTSLEMSVLNSEGNEKEKIRRMIRRMKKLIKRINKKLRHLSKEEQLETRRKAAEKRENEQEAAKLRQELSRSQKKRRREEKEYAQKEMAEDIKESAREMNFSLSGSTSETQAAPFVPELSSAAGTDITAAVSLEEASFDVTV